MEGFTDAGKETGLLSNSRSVSLVKNVRHNCLGRQGTTNQAVLSLACGQESRCLGWLILSELLQSEADLELGSLSSLTACARSQGMEFLSLLSVHAA